MVKHGLDIARLSLFVVVVVAKFDMGWDWSLTSYMDKGVGVGTEDGGSQ